MIPESKPYVLVLGGTNFMGKSLLDQLSAQNYNICCINRGKPYWNNEAHLQHPHIKWFCSDRRDHKDYCSTIRFAGTHLGISQKHKWLAVIDFCGYKWRDVQSALHAVQQLTEKYIFISTDSVYNNCLPKPTQPIEEDSIDLEAQYRKIKNTKQKQVDSYGYNKLKCQLYLRRKNAVPFVCLRLPDVIGPYDNTDRFWATLRWMQNSQQHPLPLSAQDQTKLISLVDSVSVAKGIISLINASNIPSNAYNLSFTKNFTLLEFLETIRKCVGIDVKYKATKEKISDQLYPSVECGPVSCCKAEREIGWNPLSLQEAVRMTAEFFLKRGESYREQRMGMQKFYRRKVIDKTE